MPNNNTLSIIVPVYNEEKTVSQILHKLIFLKIQGWNKQIIVVDDGSSDNSYIFAKRYIKYITLLQHKNNKGKGAALITGLKYAKSEATIIQDADLEYNPKDIIKLLKYYTDTKSRVVYGSRNLIIRKKGYFHYFWGGKVLSFCVSKLYGTNLTDINTCYKLINTALFKSIKISSSGFEFCEEITCKILKLGVKIKEVPISYNPRSFSDGKKLKMIDGIKGFVKIVSLRFID